MAYVLYTAAQYMLLFLVLAVDFIQFQISRALTLAACSYTLLLPLSIRIYCSLTLLLPYLVIYYMMLM